MMPTNSVLEISSATDLDGARPLPPVIIGDQLSTLVILDLCVEDGVKHVIQRSNLGLLEERQLSTAMQERPKDFIKYPLSMIFGDLSATAEGEKRNQSLSVSISSPEMKNDILDQLKSFANQYAKQKSLLYDITLAADELITNAVYNAPYVDFENLTSGPSRTAGGLKIDADKMPRFFAGSDGQRIVIGAQDLFGSLNVDSMMKRIRRCYQSNPRSQISFGIGGAGIGSFMMFDSCTSMYVAVDRGVSTTICCTFPVAMSAKKRSAIPKNIHILDLKPLQP